MSELAHSQPTARTVGQPPPDARDDQRVASVAPTSPRPVVIHLHLFKNAGTSVDRTLRENFDAGWATLEADHPATLAPWRLRAFVTADPTVVVVSSHTLDLPLPDVPGVTLIPIVFVRHPLDRIRSVYDFEVRQDADTPGARQAKQSDLAGYIRWRLEREELGAVRAVSDFQTHRLARGILGPTPLRRALRVADALPFVGLVEAFEESITRLQAVLSDFFPAVELKSLRENTTSSPDGTLESRLAALRSSIGEELWERLSEANRDDLTLWSAVRGRYEGSSGATRSSGGRSGG